MAVIILAVCLCAAAILIFLKMPYSATKTQFQNDIRTYTNLSDKKSTKITEQDIEGLPEPVQTYFQISGYLGNEKRTAIKAHITSAPLKDANDKPPMIVDYTLCSFGDRPVRLAYIRTSMYGIPFEAYDSTQGGVGSMKGVFGKVITLFDQRGSEMDKAQLLTYLGECFLIPFAILSENITWESIDSAHAKASISYMGVTGSGIFPLMKKGSCSPFKRTSVPELVTTEARIIRNGLLYMAISKKRTARSTPQSSKPSGMTVKPIWYTLMQVISNMYRLNESYGECALLV